MARSFWRRSDRARWDYATGLDAAGQPILPKHEREHDDRYNRRQRQAIVRRYARPILDRYCDFVTRAEPFRPEGSPAYKAFLEDCTGSGKDMDSVMRSSLRLAQTEGVSYLLLDASSPENYQSKAAEDQAGKRIIVRGICADEVIWWRDWQGEVAEALIRCAREDGTEFCWHVTTTYVQTIELKLLKSGVPVVASVGPELPHTYGGCPLVRLRPGLDEEGAGEDSQCAPLADGQKRICNIDSWLLEELQGCTFTTTVFLGIGAQQVKEVVAGSGQVICLPSSGGSNPSVGKIGSDVAQAQSIRDSLAYEIRELYRVAGLASGNPTEAAQPESGVAKAFAFNEISAKCAALADSMESAENRVVLLASNAGTFTYPGETEYPDSFDVPDLAQELAILVQMDLAALPNVLKDAQTRRIAAAGFSLTGEETAQMEAELAAPPAPAPNPFSAPKPYG